MSKTYIISLKREFWDQEENSDWINEIQSHSEMLEVFSVYRGRRALVKMDEATCQKIAEILGDKFLIEAEQKSDLY